MSAADIVVVGAGPNGLAAAVACAQKGWSVLVIEGNTEVGGGVRAAELQLPGFLQEVCSGGHPTGLASPFFRSLPLGEHGLRWRQSRVSVAHLLDDQPAVLLTRPIEETAAGLAEDAGAY